jgi:hypothetical protein
MALNKDKLLQALIDAETDSVELTPEAYQGVVLKCIAYADAIDEYIRSATVSVSVTTTHAPATINVSGPPAGATNILPVIGTGEGTSTSIS